MQAVWAIEESRKKKKKSKKRNRKEKHRLKQHRRAVQQDITPRIVEYRRAIEEFWTTFNGCKTTHDRAAIARFDSRNPPWKRIDNNLRLLMREEILDGVGRSCSPGLDLSAVRVR